MRGKRKTHATRSSLAILALCLSTSPSFASELQLTYEILRTDSTQKDNKSKAVSETMSSAVSDAVSRAASNATTITTTGATPIVTPDAAPSVTRDLTPGAAQDTTQSATPEPAGMSSTNSNSPPSDAASKVPQKRTKTFFLGPDYICVQDGDKRDIYDFAKNRLLTLDTSKHTYQDHSLFSVIAFRSAEIRNRMMLSNILNAAGVGDIGDGSFDPFALESLFSLTGPGNSAAQIEVTDEGSQKIFKHKGIVAVRFQPSSTAIGEHGDMFQKFLIYCCSLHPSIRRQLESLAKVPQILQFDENNFPAYSQTVQFKLLNKDEVSVGHAAEVPRDYVRTLDNENPMQPLLAQPKNPMNSTLPTQQEAQKSAEKFIAANDSLDALLTLLEYSLVSGEQVSPKIAELMQKVKQDEQCRKLVSSLTPKSEAEAEEAIKTLNSLDKPGVQKAYVLNIFRANVLRPKNPAMAQTLLAEAARRNPYLTGAFKDLGDIYYSRYDTTTAFDCWDMGRRFFPRHPMMADVNHLETSLQDAFAEYFLKKK